MPLALTRVDFNATSRFRSRGAIVWRPNRGKMPSEYEVIYNGLLCWTAKNGIIFQFFFDAMFRYERTMLTVIAEGKY